MNRNKQKTFLTEMWQLYVIESREIELVFAGQVSFVNSSKSLLRTDFDSDDDNSCEDSIQLSHPKIVLNQRMGDLEHQSSWRVKLSCCRVILRRIHCQTLHASVVLVVFALMTGCVVPGPTEVSLPGNSILEREQLIVHSDFYIPSKHRLIDELTAKRRDIADQLKLPVSDEPINVFVFQTEDQFRRFMDREFPSFPSRRAFFVKNDTTLRVFAYWGEKIGEDLRHEVTHGYLHSVVSNLPLWLDEGLAEYYEVPRGGHGLNDEHVYLLNNAFRRKEWSPDLAKLQALSSPAEMSQLHYAEAWLWVHFLLENPNGDAKLLQDQLARLRMSAESEPLSDFIDQQVENRDVLLLEHLKTLAESM